MFTTPHPVLFRGEYETKQEPADWLRSWFTTMATLTDAECIARFRMHCGVASQAEVWYDSLTATEKSSWMTFEAAFHCRWPSLAPPRRVEIPAPPASTQVKLQPTSPVIQAQVPLARIRAAPHLVMRTPSPQRNTLAAPIIHNMPRPNVTAPNVQHSKSTTPTVHTTPPATHRTTPGVKPLAHAVNTDMAADSMHNAHANGGIGMGGRPGTRGREDEEKGECARRTTSTSQGAYTKTVSPPQSSPHTRAQRTTTPALAATNAISTSTLAQTSTTMTPGVEPQTRAVNTTVPANPTRNANAAKDKGIEGDKRDERASKQTNTTSVQTTVTSKQTTTTGTQTTSQPPRTYASCGMQSHDTTMALKHTNPASPPRIYVSQGIQTNDTKPPHIQTKPARPPPAHRDAGTIIDKPVDENTPAAPSAPTALNWADDVDATLFAPTVTLRPRYPPRDFSALKSSTKNP